MMELPLPRVLFSVILFFGLVFAFLIPPMQTPDEDAHFLRAYAVSRGEIMPRRNGDDCGKVPDAFLAYTNKYNAMKRRLDQKYAYSRWRSDAYAVDNLKPETPYCSSAQTASPLLYIPPTVGILAGKLIYWASPLKQQTYNWMAASYFARLGNLLALAIAAAVACAWAPRFGAVIFALSTLPMVLQAAASPSYDITTLSACLLFFALVVKIASRQTSPARWEMAGLIILAFFVAQAKIVYAPGVAAAWALKRWMSPRAFVQLCIGLGLAVVAGAVTGSNGANATVHEIELQHQQLSQILAHPGRDLMRILHTLDHERDYYTVGFLGDFSWLETLVPLPLLMMIWAMLFSAVLGDALRGPSPLGWATSGLLLIGAAASFVGVMMVLYVISTSKMEGVGAPLITGVQGRYFVPLAIPVMAAIAASPRAVAQKAGALRLNLLQVQVTLATATLSVCGLVLLARFWLPDTGVP
jgi:uncharacterized membrane protein